LVLVQHDYCQPGRQAPCRCRPRICLLKGCERWFLPLRSSARYCSKACSDAARKWSQWHAAWRYRQSEKGKERRREQADRYRKRVRQRRQAAEEEPPSCEGHQQEPISEKIPCSRPGCYELFRPQRRSPLKKFCCALCRNALRRVRQRETRWQEGSSSLPRAERREPFRGPPAGFR